MEDRETGQEAGYIHTLGTVVGCIRGDDCVQGAEYSEAVTSFMRTFICCYHVDDSSNITACMRT